MRIVCEQSCKLSMLPDGERDRFVLAEISQLTIPEKSLGQNRVHLCNP